MRYRNYHRKPEIRTITAKFDGQCYCCGAAIKAGEMVSHYPAGTVSHNKGVIAHMGGLEGNSARCSANIAKQMQQRDSDFIDIDRAYEDQCADICGR